MSVTEAMLWVLAGLLAAGAWFLLRSGDPKSLEPDDNSGKRKFKKSAPAMSAKERELRDARSKVEQQLETLEHPLGFRGRPDTRQLQQDLRDILHEIDQELTELGKTAS